MTEFSVPEVTSGGAVPPDEGAARAAEVSRLRVLGMTYQQIADRLGYADRSTPRRLLSRHLRAVLDENIGDLRRIENERMDIAVSALMPIISSRDTDASIRVRAIDSLVRVSARRAALNGLDAPITVSVQNGLETALAELSDLVLGEVVANEPAEAEAIEAPPETLAG